MDDLIEITDVTKRYDDDGRPAVDGVSLTVAAGEAVAIMGPSGSGKSTLLNLVAGLDRPTSGSVTVAGQRIDKLSETAVARFRRQRIGMIFQFFNLLDDLTVADNVLLPAQLAGLPRATARARTDGLLGRLGISAHADAYPARLSGGERQRVAIASGRPGPRMTTRRAAYSSKLMLWSSSRSGTGGRIPTMPGPGASGPRYRPGQCGSTS